MIVFTRSRMNRFDYGEWVFCFERNAAGRLKIDFSEESGLTEEERKLIFPSVRAFQKGESSGGKYLMRAAEAFDDADYIRAMRWFIGEENVHSSYLKKYMGYYHVKTVGFSVLDGIFRRLRRLGGLKCEITVLVTAEMIALTYYDALSRCTDSPALKSICRQMLRDEVPHVMFQSYTLGRLGVRRTDRAARVLLMELTMFAVWAAFHDVYRAGGYTFRRFAEESFGYLRQSVRLSERRYAGSFCTAGIRVKSSGTNQDL